MLYSPHAINTIFENELPNYCKDCKVVLCKEKTKWLIHTAFYEKVFSVKWRHLQKRCNLFKKIIVLFFVLLRFTMVNFEVKKK